MGDEISERKINIPHTYGVTSSFVFTLSAYRKAGRWNVKSDVSETLDLLRSFHEHMIPYHQLITHSTKIKNRHRWSSYFGSDAERRSGMHSIDSSYRNLHNLKGLAAKPYFNLDEWIDRFSQSITSEVKKFDLRDDELDVVAGLNPERMNALPQNVRLQSLLQIVHIADIARNEYPGIYSLVRSLINPSKKKAK